MPDRLSLFDAALLAHGRFPPRLDPRIPPYYGARSLAAEYCGLTRVPTTFRGVWAHGWCPDARQLDPGLVVQHPIERRAARALPLWVARKSEERYLREQGLEGARAIGHPLVYVAERSVPRIKGSLLVMPAHSLPYTRHAWRQREYAEAIAAIAPAFSEVVACVSVACFDKGYWISELRRVGIPVIEGASPFDVNALRRLSSVWSAAEFVTTNAFGSLIPYASYFGCKVSLFGPIAEVRPEDHAAEPFYRGKAELLARVCDDLSEQALRRSMPGFFTHPAEAIERTAWAAEELGERNRLAPGSLRMALGWTVPGRLADIARDLKAALGRGTRRTLARLARNARGSGDASSS